MGEQSSSIQKRVSLFDLALEDQFLRKDIGKDIRSRRIALGWGISEIAARLHTPEFLIISLEQGEIFHSLGELQTEALLLLERVEDFREGKYSLGWVIYG